MGNVFDTSGFYLHYFMAECVYIYTTTTTTNNNNTNNINNWEHYYDEKPFDLRVYSILKSWTKTEMAV